MTPGEQEPGSAPTPASAADPETVPEDDDRDGDAADASVWRDWTREDLKRSAAAGAAAYVASYALLYLWFLSDGRMAGEFTDWRWVGWILYRGQFVPLEASGPAANVVEGGLGAAANVVPSLLLSLVVVATAGFLLARARGAVEPEAAVETGASLVVGYLPLALLGIVVFAGTLPNGVHVRPNPLVAPFVTGLAFPAVVGALGGMAFYLRDQRNREDAEEPVDGDAPDAESPEPRP